MINPDVEPGFPNNVVRLLNVVLPSIDDSVVMQMRPLRPSDPNMSIGAYGTLWTPDENSQEMRGATAGEPTLGRYSIGIQSLVKDGDAQRGLAISSIVANRIRGVLYRNDPLRVAFASLVSEDAGARESMRRWGVSTQRYMTNEIERMFVTISVVDMWIETEII